MSHPFPSCALPSMCCWGTRMTNPDPDMWSVTRVKQKRKALCMGAELHSVPKCVRTHCCPAARKGRLVSSLYGLDICPRQSPLFPLISFTSLSDFFFFFLNFDLPHWVLFVIDVLNKMSERMLGGRLSDHFVP